jgi:hypothetical protein
MKNTNKNIKLVIMTYLLGILMFNILSYLINIIIPNNADWEIFSFNLFGSLSFYGIALIIFIGLSFIISFDKIKKIILLLFLIFLVEISCLLITSESITFELLKIISLEKNKSYNYTLLLYPTTLLTTFIISIIILKRITPGRDD